MKSNNILRRARLRAGIAAIAVGLSVAGASAPVLAQPNAYASGSYRPSNRVLLSVGEGQVVNLPRGVSSVWTSNPKVADVYVTSARQINVFGKDSGEATVIATASDGSIVYGANVRVNQNLSSINDILRQAMPESNINVTTVGQIAVINGSVASPDDAAQAQELVRAMLNPGIKAGEPLNIVPINRLKTATPLQVTLMVRFAEVNRTLIKKIGVNLLTADPTNGFKFGILQGAGIFLPTPGGDGKGAGDIIRSPTGSTLAGMGKLFCLDVTGTLDLAQTDGLVTTLAEPNLTALSGETASFLAGGEFPIPVAQGNNAISIEYKQYGVGLAFTPVVLGDGRISMRVRPEVSELSEAGSVRLNGFTVPSLTTRRAETTVELGSGQSFMLAGLLQNRNRNNVEKAPFLGDLPILGMLFRSTGYQRDETELVIIVTPYLVRPVSGQLATPVDGYRAPTDVELNVGGQTFEGQSGARAPVAMPGTAPAAPGFKL